MFWADKIAKEIVESGKYRPYWVDDMFTPSGHAHIGSLRGPLVHDMIHRALRDAGEHPSFTYVFNDFDPIDGLPPELSDTFSKYLGFPLRKAPAPEKGYESFADFFAKDFQKVLKSLGFAATYLSSWDMYHEGKFNEVIREALDNSERIQDIYQQVSGSKKREKGWLPLQVICEKCGKLGTTRVHNWDGDTVSYACESAMVTWAKGCGYNGKISPFDGNGKLPWKVDWPAHWKVLGITIEGAGKDHSSAGGSRDIARALCDEVFHVPDPYNLPYEFFLIGGKKMSSSKGLGLKARDLTTFLPPSVGRFLFTRTDHRQAIEFDPIGTMAIPDLFDEYDHCWQSYIDESDQNLARAFILAQTDQLPPKKPMFLPRFRDIANYIQLPNVDLVAQIAKGKGSALTSQEQLILEERKRYATIWVQIYAPDDYRFQMTTEVSPEVSGLTKEQKNYLADIIPLVESNTEADDLQLKLYEAAKALSIDSKKAFTAIYIALLGKTHGPKAGWLLRSYPTEVVVERLRQITIL
jgi:lysyl-tRNA synthetase class 1